MGFFTGGKEKWRGGICWISTANRQEGGRAEAVYHSLSLPGARAGEQQEVHFHTVVINQWKSLPRDVMGAKSVKGVQKGIIQINGRESLQRLLNNESGSSLWLSCLCAADCQSQGGTRGWGPAFLWLSTCTQSCNSQMVLGEMKLGSDLAWLSSVLFSDSYC